MAEVLNQHGQVIDARSNGRSVPCEKREERNWSWERIRDYHGLAHDNDTCVQTAAAWHSLPWWVAALHNFAHYPKHMSEPYRLPFWLCRVFDWLAGSMCLYRRWGFWY